MYFAVLYNSINILENLARQNFAGRPFTCACTCMNKVFTVNSRNSEKHYELRRIPLIYKVDTSLLRYKGCLLQREFTVLIFYHLLTSDDKIQYTVYSVSETVQSASVDLWCKFTVFQHLIAFFCSHPRNLCM